MGYYIFSFGIKTEQIQQVFGSKNAAFQLKVEQSETYQHYADEEIDDFETTTKQAIIDIIQGKPFNEKSGYAYGYGLIVLCGTFGESLPYTQDIKLGFDTDAIEKVLTDDFGLSDCNIVEIMLPFEPKHPFPIPEIDDWPIIGLIKHSELQDIKNKFSAINITDDAIAALGEAHDEKEYAYEHLQGILQNINYCLENGLDLISFCH